MTEATEPSCASCKHFATFGKLQKLSVNKNFPVDGICRRWPPDHNDMSGRYVQPEVTNDDLCGEFAPR